MAGAAFQECPCRCFNFLRQVAVGLLRHTDKVGTVRRTPFCRQVPARVESRYAWFRVGTAA